MKGDQESETTAGALLLYIREGTPSPEHSQDSSLRRDTEQSQSQNLQPAATDMNSTAVSLLMCLLALYAQGTVTVPLCESSISA